MLQKVRNENFRKSSHLVDAAAPEMSEKQQLEQKLMKAREKFRRKKIDRDGAKQGVDSLIANKRDIQKVCFILYTNDMTCVRIWRLQWQM